MDVTVHARHIGGQRASIAEVLAASGGPWGGETVSDKLIGLVRAVIGAGHAVRVPDDLWADLRRGAIEDLKRKVGADNSSRVYLLQLTAAFLGALREAGAALAEVVRSTTGVSFRQRSGALQFERHIVEECFRETSDQIVQHLQSVVARARGVHCILLVGGFSESPLLVRNIREAFQSQPVTLVPAKFGGVAVLRGAVRYGQNPDVIETRIARYTYGVAVIADFDEQKHPASRKEIIDGQECVRDVLDVLVACNKAVHIGQPVTKTYTPATANQRYVTIKLYRTPLPRAHFIDDVNCELLSTIQLDVAPSRPTGRRELQVSMDFSRTSLQFSAMDRCSRERYQVEVKFD